jgi:ethanolamine utilization microcompartment shell protein EutS
MRITKGGNVGIGTTAPTSSVHINGLQTNSGSTSASIPTGTMRLNFAGASSTNEYGASLVFTQRWWTNSTAEVAMGQIAGVKETGNGNYGGGLAFFTSNNTSNNLLERLRINKLGNVGIGTTSPNSKLDIRRSGSGVALELHQTSGSANDFVDLKMIAGSTSAGTLGTILRHKRDGTGGGDFSILTNPSLAGTPTEKLIVKSSGNVGIGTTSPAAKLDVNGDIAVKGASIINKASAALTIGDIAGNDSVTNLTLTTAGRSTEVFLDDSGNVGVNTATPSYNLTVDSGANDIGIVTASSDSGSYVGFLDNATSTIPKVGAVGNKLILDASQYVGVRKTNPSYALDVNGTIRATGNVIAYSDARVKENVETIPNALDKVKAMRGVGYNKIGEEKRSIGVIAQEMLEVMPEVVSQDEQGMYSVAYGNLVGVLIEAVKEQQQQIDELKKQIK